MAPDAAPYVPGACNIGQAEIRLRKVSGWVGVAATVAGAGLFLWFEAPAWWRLGLFFPAFAGALGLLQGYQRFCAHYGWLGVFNVGPGIRRTQTVEDAEDARRDRRKAARTYAYSLLAGMVAAVAVFFVPV